MKSVSQEIAKQAVKSLQEHSQAKALTQTLESQKQKNWALRNRILNIIEDNLR